MQTIKACEQMGIQTVAVMQESGNPDGSDPTVVDFVPEANALISVGGIGWHTPARRHRAPCSVLSAERLSSPALLRIHATPPDR